MKLPRPILDIQTKLREFDVWITPSLGEIRDTEQFKTELARFAETFDRIGKATGNFASPDKCKPDEIANAFVNHAGQLDFASAAASLEELASVLFLVTGKSDNNVKCQIPLYLRDQVKLTSFPVVVKSGKKKNPIITTKDRDIPRTLKSVKYMEVVAALKNSPERQKAILNHFIKFLLSDDTFISQLWSIGYSYFGLKSFSKEKDFLSPLVVFKIRGSVTASGGHDSENLLRKRLVEWGMEPGIDFNLSDVSLPVLKRLLTGDTAPPKSKKKKKKQKTRAYDFVLPFKTLGDHQRICIQSQFYAGDAGSVSHKNVDQTSSSRKEVRAFASEAIFVEYVDGAGYFSSLNGDLANLLEMKGSEFFQVRTSPIRLRRELQHAGFLVPLEVQQATFRADDPTRENVATLLKKDGYLKKEVERGINVCLARGLIQEKNGKLISRDSDREKVRRYLLLDVAAIKGETHGNSANDQVDLVMVPGYGPFHGIKGLELIREAKVLAPGFTKDLDKSEYMLADLDWLKEQKMTL